MIPYTTEINIFKSLFQKGNYKKVKISDDILKKYNITFKIARAIVSNYTTDHVIKQFHLIQHKINKLQITDENILEVSKKIDFPPYQLLKMCEKRYGQKYKNEIVKLCLENDDYSNMKKIGEKALKFEKRVEKYLKKSNIEYQTQDDLTKLGSKLTPDFLLKEPLIYKGEKIIWIDAKNSFGANNSFSRKNLNKQNKKYNDYFGQGLFVFHYSYSDALKIANGIFTDYDEFKKLLKKEKI